MRALLPLALLSFAFAPALPGQNFWGPACSMRTPEGYSAVEAGQGWGYTVDLIADSETSQAPVSLLRVAFLLQAESPNALMQQYWASEGGQLAQAGWELVGSSESIERTIKTMSLGEFEEDEDPPGHKACTGQRLTLQHNADPERRAEVQLFAWREDSGSFGLARSFAEGEEQKAKVETAFEELMTWGVDANQSRNVHVHGIGFSIPILAQHEVREGTAGESMLRIGREEGLIEILVGAKDPDNASEQSSTVLTNLSRRLDLLEAQGLGTHGETQLRWMAYRNELRRVELHEWREVGKEPMQIYAVALVLNGRPVLMQSQPKPGQDAVLGEHLLRLIRSGLAVPGSRSGELWNAVQLREYGTQLPQRILPSWLPLQGEPGLLLARSGMDFKLWMSCIDYEKHAELPQQLESWMRAYLEQAGLTVDVDRLQSTMMDIYPDDDTVSFPGDPIPTSVPRIQYLDASGEEERVFFATLRPFRKSCALAIVESKPVDQLEAERLAIGALERALFASSQGAKSLQYIHRSHFPLRYPGNEFAAWSAESEDGSSFARLFHAEGEMELRDYDLTELNEKGFMASTQTSSEIGANRSSRMRKGEAVGASSKSKRMIGGKLREWHGFEFTKDDLRYRHVASVWKNGMRRYRLSAHYRDEAGQPSEFLASLNRCAVDKVVGRSGAESLPNFPVPFGGMWTQVPDSIGLSDVFDIATGYGITLRASAEQDWSANARVFLVQEAESEAEAFAMLWKAGQNEVWEGGIEPEVSSAQMEWLGGTVAVQRRIGRLQSGRKFSVSHAIHFSGRVCRSWTVRGTDFALESVSEVLELMRNRFEIVSGIATAPVLAGERSRHPVSGFEWELDQGYLADAAGIENGMSFEHQETFCQLVRTEIPEDQTWAMVLASVAGLVKNGDRMSPAEARQQATPHLLEVHGQLRPALVFSSEGLMVAMGIARAGNKAHLVMTFISTDPLQDLVQALQGWPKPAGS